MKTCAGRFGQLRFSPRPRASTVVRKYSWTGDIALIEDGGGHVESRERSAAFGIDFQNADRFSLEYGGFYEFLPAPFRIAPDVTLPVGRYNFDNVRLEFNRAQLQSRIGILSAEYGTSTTGTRPRSASAAAVSPRDAVSVEPTYSINRVELVQGSFTTHLRLTRDVDRHAVDVHECAGAIQLEQPRALANVRFRWEYRPGSELFVVYNEERDTLARRFPALANRASSSRSTA